MRPLQLFNCAVEVLVASDFNDIIGKVRTFSLLFTFERQVLKSLAIIGQNCACHTTKLPGDWRGIGPAHVKVVTGGHVVIPKRRVPVGATSDLGDTTTPSCSWHWESMSTYLLRSHIRSQQPSSLSTLIASLFVLQYPSYRVCSKSPGAR